MNYFNLFTEGTFFHDEWSWSKFITCPFLWAKPNRQYMETAFCKECKGIRITTDIRAFVEKNTLQETKPLLTARVPDLTCRAGQPGSPGPKPPSKEAKGAAVTATDQAASAATLTEWKETPGSSSPPFSLQPSLYRADFLKQPIRTSSISR